MKDKQKHFLTEKSIVKEIDRVKDCINNRRKEIAEEDQKMQGFIKASMRADIHFCQTQIEMMEKSITRYQVKLDRLKETLATFNAELLPGFEGKQVVLEKLR